MRRLSVIALLLIAIVGASAFLYRRLQPEPQPAQLVYASGRIEADEVRVAPEIAGRLVEHRPREGEAVRAGELLARIDPVDFELQAGQASAQLTATRRAASQIDAQTHLARHHAQTTRTDLARYETLRGQGWVTIQQLDVRRNAYMAASDQVSVLRQQRAQADAQSDVAARSLALARERLARTRISLYRVGTKWFRPFPLRRAHARPAGPLTGGRNHLGSVSVREGARAPCRHRNRPSPPADSCSTWTAPS